MQQKDKPVTWPQKIICVSPARIFLSIPHFYLFIFILFKPESNFKKITDLKLSMSYIIQDDTFQEQEIGRPKKQI